MEKPLETSRLGSKVGQDRASGNQQGWANSVSQADVISDWHLPVGSVGREGSQQRYNVLCQHFCLRGSCPSSSGPDAKWFSSFPYVWLLSSCCPSARVQREWVWVSPCMSPLGGTAWDSRSFHFPQSQYSLFFIARNYKDFSSRHWNPDLEGLVWGWDPQSSGGLPQPSSPSWFFTTICGCGTSLFCVSALPTILDVVLSLIP